MGRVEGKVAIVTGAARGLGAAAAIALHAEGAALVVTDVDTDSGMALATSLGMRALFLKLDVTQEADWTDVIAATLEKFGRLDVLVNNAGVVVVGTIEDTTLERLRFVQRVDGPFLGYRHALFRSAGLNGRPSASYHLPEGLELRRTRAYHRNPQGSRTGIAIR